MWANSTRSRLVRVPLDSCVHKKGLHAALYVVHHIPKGLTEYVMPRQTIIAPGARDSETGNRSSAYEVPLEDKSGSKAENTVFNYLIEMIHDRPTYGIDGIIWVLHILFLLLFLVRQS